MLRMYAISRTCSVRSCTFIPVRITQRQSHAGGSQRYRRQKTSSLTETRTPTIISSTGSTSLNTQTLPGTSCHVDTLCSHDKTSMGFCQCRGVRHVCRATEDEVKNGDKEDNSAVSRILDDFPALGEGLGSAVLFLLWAAVVAYALLLSPNQTPARDQYFIEKLVGLQRDDYQINTLFYCLFNAMGVYPLIFLSLLQPSGKSSNKVPLWPFTTLSFGLGFLALGPYFALWKPSGDVQTPPAPPQLEGWKNLSLKMTESTIFSLVLLLIVVGLAATAAGAALSVDQWREYLHLWEESRLVNVSTLDFGLLTAFAPFWIQNDAQRRNWADRERLVPILSVIPLLGPAIYLVLRPKAN